MSLGKLFQGFVLLLQLFAAVPGFAVETPGDDGEQIHPIIEGDVSAPGGQSWIVALMSDDSRSLTARHFCGGTLIASTWVLTAAHCLDGVDVDDFDVVVGREQLGASDGVVLAPAEIVLHPFFDPVTLRNDIALIRLAAPATSATLRRATASDDAVLAAATTTVYGWGFQSFKGNYGCDLNFIDAGGSHADYWCETKVYSFGAKGPNLEEGSQRLHSFAECDARYREFLLARDPSQQLPDEPYFSEATTPNVICAWDQADVQAPCFGDSGGPLVGQINGQPVLLGVVSFAYAGDCEIEGQLGIYARVSSYAAFIDDVVGREPALAFGALCPRQPEPRVEFRPLIRDVSRVTITWAADAAATGWRLYYAGAGLPGSRPGTIDMPASARNYEVNLRAGQSYHVALQARGAACDSALSALQKVIAP